MCDDSSLTWIFHWPRSEGAQGAEDGRPQQSANGKSGLKEPLNKSGIL